jgi:endonuclease/exonuclease/phosphatase (EEP) superfamily protein YafD
MLPFWKHVVRAIATTYRLFLLLAAVVVAFLPLMPSALAAYFAIAAYTAWPVFVLCLSEAILLRKKSLWCMTFLLGAIVSFTWVRYFLPVWQTGGKLAESTTLCLVSGNVDNFGLCYQDYSNLRHQAELINRYNPDIICLQERPHTNVISFDSIRMVFKAYPYFVVNTREDEVLNLVIFSRYPLHNPVEYYFPDSYNKIISASIAMGKDSLRLYNVHLQTTRINGSSSSGNCPLVTMIQNEKLRNLQADQLCRNIDHTLQPVIVTGDFNASRTSYAYRNLASVLSDCCQPSFGLHGTWQPLGPLLKIDHTLCSENIYPHSYALADNPWSDHRLQVVSIQLQETCKPGLRK